MVVEAMDPVAQRQAIHAANPCRLRPVHPVQYCSQRQKTPALVLLFETVTAHETCARIVLD
jgi:hypothetical protein